MKQIKNTLKKNRISIILFLIFVVIDFSVFALYEASLEPAIYSSVMGLVILLMALVIDYCNERKKEKERQFLLSSVSYDISNMPKADTSAEEDYQQMLRILAAELEKLKNEYSKESHNSIDYYTNWVHQIKTPIAVMKLKLTDDTPENRALSDELFRIEQYVDMVLQYIRLGSESNDLLIREYDLDELIKESVKKFAHQFIGKKLKLDYSPVDKKIVTDKKWFCCILEQLISNAIKYTNSGSVSISLKDNKLLITDTGIGINEEDIPRIFEMGYTGNNGRKGEKSSGLGLYLAKKSADLISIPISVDSEADKGTTFSLDISQSKYQFD